MFISNDSKFVFIHVPKCAGSTMHIFFKDKYSVEDRTDPPPLIHHMPYEQYIRENPHAKNYFSFAFTRNPWSRVVSSFHDYNIKERRGREEYRSFDSFVKERLPEVLLNKPEEHTIHYFPSLYFTKGVDFVGKVENIQEDWERIMEVIMMDYSDMKLKYHHRATGTGKRYREYYDSKTKEIVQHFYADDIKEFGYEF